MTTIVTRAGKGSPLTNNEVDANFVNLNTDKIETLTSTDSSVTITGTGASRDLSVPVNPNVVLGPVSATDNAVARYDGTTGKLIQNSVVTVDDTGNVAGILSEQFADGTAVTLAAGKQWYNGTTGSWNLGMGGGNITQQVGEEIFVYGKASAAITEGQLICKTGTVGASGVITFAPSPASLADNDGIIGIATEDIPLNGLGRITYYGVVRGINTTGSSVGETWLDNDTLYYSPAGGGSLTKVKPSAPNIKYQVATVINVGSGGSGSLQVNLQAGTTLGGTDNNVQLSTPTGGQLLTYDAIDTYWKNTSLTAGTAISVSPATNGVITVTNTAPDQVVALTGAGTTSVTGTYPNFTITSGDAYTGTVTNVTGTAPIAVANGTTTPSVSISQANTTTDGYLSATDWNTFNNKYTLPSQTGNAGKVLTTDGSTATWQAVDADPAGTAVAMSIALG